MNSSMFKLNYLITTFILLNELVNKILNNHFINSMVIKIIYS